MNRKMNNEAREREMEICKNKYPQYIHFISDDLNASRIKMYCRLFEIGVTPEVDPNIFEEINNRSTCDFNSEITDYIKGVYLKRSTDEFVEYVKGTFPNFTFPKNFDLDTYERINITSIKNIKSPGSKYLDYIHVEVEVLQGSLQEKINFAKEYKSLIMFKVFRKLKSIHGNKFNFLKLYDYKFYSKPTVADSGLVIGLLRFEWKDL